jgi:small redox-active disulfide protein 2
MLIQIFGSGGCSRCSNLLENAKQAANKAGVDADIEKVTDMDKLTEIGVLMTPGLAINGKLKKSGKVLTPEQIQELIEQEK